MRHGGRDMRPRHRASEGAHRVRLGGQALGIVALVLAVSLAAAPPARAQLVREVSQVTFTVQTVREGGVRVPSADANNPGLEGGAFGHLATVERGWLWSWRSCPDLP